MARGVERREVPAHARSHQYAGFPGRGARHLFELPGDGEALEIAGREVRDFNFVAGGAEAFGEEARLARAGARGEAVQVDDFLSHNLISASALNTWKRV